MKPIQLFNHEAIARKAIFVGFFRKIKPRGLCKHEHCEIKPKRASFMGWREAVKCKRVTYRPYTDQDLATPGVVIDAAAIKMDIAVECYHNLHPGMTGLYDLIEDKWANDNWWTLHGGKSRIIFPRAQHSGVQCISTPSKVANIAEIISLIKEKL
jgi:hypothetical protein